MVTFCGMSTSLEPLLTVTRFRQAFLVACLISFPALFTQQRKTKQKFVQQVPHDDQLRTFGNSWKKGRNPSRSLVGTFVDTCHDLEGTTQVDVSDLEAGKQGFILAEVKRGSQSNGSVGSDYPRNDSEDIYMSSSIDHRQAHNLHDSIWDGSTEFRQGFEPAHVRHG